MNKELQECAQLNDHEWNRSLNPIMLDHKVPENVNWYRLLNGKKLRLTLLEVKYSRFNEMNSII